MVSNRQKKQEVQERKFNDAFDSYVTSYSNRTKSILNKFQTKNVLNNDNRLYLLKAQLTQNQFGNIYQNHFIVNKCINTIVERMFKNGINFIFEDKEYQKREEEFERFYRIHYVPIIKKAIMDTFIYGGGLILQQDTKQKTKGTYYRSSDTTLYYIPRIMYSTLPSYIPNTTIANGVSQFILGSYSKNQIGAYSTPYGQVSEHKNAVDKSFFINFDGLHVPYELFNSVYQYQGGSLIAPNIDNIKADTILLESIGNLAFRNGVLIYKQENFLDKIGGTEEEIINTMKRHELLNSGVNSTGMATIDKNEDIIALGARLEQLDELSKMLLERMVGYFGLSLTDILGRSPAGMNSTGESDISHSVQTIESWQEHFYKPIYQVGEVAVYKFFNIKKKDRKKDEPLFKLEFNDPRVENKKEKAEYEAMIVSTAIERNMAMEDDRSLEYLERHGIITGEEKEEAIKDNKMAKIDLNDLDKDTDKNNQDKKNGKESQVNKAK